MLFKKAHISILCQGCNVLGTEAIVVIEPHVQAYTRSITYSPVSAVESKGSKCRSRIIVHKIDIGNIFTRTGAGLKSSKVQV
jgi:hypothetical protein